MEKPTDKTVTEEEDGGKSWSRYATLMLLTLSYTLGELGHFLIATTSKQVANSLEFGDMRCYARDSHDGNTTSACPRLSSAAACEAGAGCVWSYSGQGWQYQVLAGPGFIVIFTVCGVVMGYLADRVSRPRLLSASLLVFSLCMMLSGLATGEAAIRPAGGSLIAELFQSKQRGIANGIF